MQVNLDFPLYFLRHGETFYNAEGRIQGQLDTQLTPKGRAQAAEAGQRLDRAIRAEGQAPGDFGYFASPLSRASDTMVLARRAMGLAGEAFQKDNRLMELNFGQWQDLTWPEIRARDPAAVAARTEHFWTVAPPGGESYADLTDRVRTWLVERSGATVVVAHGGIARALMSLIDGMTPDEIKGRPILQGRVLAFARGPGRWL